MSTESKAILTIPAIYQFWGSVQELSTFVLVIETCVEYYYSSGGETQSLSSADLARNNPTWRDNAIRKVGLLLPGELRIWSTFAGPDNDGGWSCVIAKDIRRFRGVKTIEQYLEKRTIHRKIPDNIPPQPTNIDFQSIVLPTDLESLQLHPDIRSKCWDLYATEKYDEAIFNATKAVEVAVRTKAHLSDKSTGVDVINTAFSSKKPILRYSTMEAEQEGMMYLLRGIIQVYRNAHGHRFVGVQNKSECLGILLMCSNMLFVVDDTEFVGTI